MRRHPNSKKKYDAGTPDWPVRSEKVEDAHGAGKGQYLSVVGQQEGKPDETPKNKSDSDGRFFTELEAVLKRTGGSATITASMTKNGLRAVVAFQKGEKDDEVELPPSFVVTGTGKELDSADGLEAFLADAAEGCKSLTEQRALSKKRIERYEKAIKKEERKAKEKAKEKAKSKEKGGKKKSSGGLFSTGDEDDA